MKIQYTKHAESKFKISSFIKITPKLVEAAVKSPDSLVEDHKRSVWIALRKLDQRRDLRVIYNERNGIITVITFYPVKKGRYSP